VDGRTQIFAGVAGWGAGGGSRGDASELLT